MTPRTATGCASMPKGELTPADTQMLAEHKPELIALLAEIPASPDDCRAPDSSPVSHGQAVSNDGRCTVHGRYLTLAELFFQLL